MCSTCNYKEFDGYRIDRTLSRFENRLGNTDIVLRCDENGKNWKLGIEGKYMNEFTIYRCPTCGRKLF